MVQVKLGYVAKFDLTLLTIHSGGFRLAQFVYDHGTGIWQKW